MRCSTFPPPTRKDVPRREIFLRFASLPLVGEFSSLSGRMTISSHPLHSCLRVVALAVVAVLLLTACDSPQGIIREIRGNLDAFKANPGDSSLKAVEESFSRIDAVIKDLEEREDHAQADLFRRQAMTLRYEYRAMRSVFLKWREEQSLKPVLEKAGAGGSDE